MKDIFILGCERSGSTWLANIFDVHPQVEFIMEPFADYACIFEGFPDRNVYVDADALNHANVIAEGYRHMQTLKYPFLYRPGKPVYYLALDRFLANKYARVKRALRIKNSQKFDQYLLLNLNNRETPLSKLTRKNRRPSFRVTKELRLNFKIPVLTKVFPSARFVVIIRHPGAQLMSIRKLFDRNRLGELSRWLNSFFEVIGRTGRFENYRPLVKELSPDDLLPFWWLINYQTLLEDLEDRAIDHTIVFHEDLSAAPHDVVADIFDFCGISFHETVKKYLTWSTSKSGNSNYNPVNTRRDSAAYIEQGIRGVDADLNKRIERIFKLVSEVNPIKLTIAEYLKRWYFLE